MSTKDLFNKSNKVLTKSQEEKIKKDLESPELSKDVVKSNNKFHSHIDFSKPENFSFYGSAQKYYEDSFNRIYQTYPYDGSQSEKEKWFYDSSELDLWILDNTYPKSTGYVRLGTGQSIFVKGGPNKQPGIIEGEKEELSKQFPIKQGNSNIWDTSIYRNSNLYLDAEIGNTIEFWAKMDNPTSLVYPFVIGNINSTRISFMYTNGLIEIEYRDDNSDGFTAFASASKFIESTWNHYAFTFINEGSSAKIEIYKNGSLVETLTGGSALSDISQENLYLNINGTLSAVNGAVEDTIDGLYIDEFRFWKRRRTEEEIGRYWHTHIQGGTNTDDNKYSTENRKVDIGVYYKFNEGITGNDTIDSTILDYSGRISNGEILNYNSSVRSTGSALDESGFFEVSEEKEPIIYSSHPDFVSAKETYMQEGLTYDYTNNSSIYHTMPAWIIEEDEEKGENVKELSQVISSYFDSAQIKIKELVNLKDVEYHTLEERTNKPYSLIRRTLESAGMVVPDLFTEASAFEEILSRGEQEKFEEKLQDVKNTIYQNIYNNLSYIYKSKGTEKAFRNLIRCFGIDDELVKINLYSDGADYTLEDTRRTTAIKKKFVDFNNADREDGLVYTKEDPSNADSTSYIRGVPNGISPNLSFTFETEVIFPKSIDLDHPTYDPPTNLEEHIAFLGEYNGGYTGNTIFDLKAVKENNDPLSENIKFVLTFNGQTLETDYFKSVYENSKWNLAVRLVPKKRLSSVVSGGSTTDFTAELYCVRMLADVVEDEEWVVGNVLEADARDILSSDKFVSVGALHSSGNPEVNSLDNETRLKISSTLFWYDNVTNEEIRAHASDASNFGRLHPNEEAYMFDANFNTETENAIQVLRRDTLAMHWDFSEVTTTDGSGEFIVDDLSEALEPSIVPLNENSISFDGTSAGMNINDSIEAFRFTLDESPSDASPNGPGTPGYTEPDPSGDLPFSISAWCYVEQNTGATQVIVSKWMDGQGVGTKEYFLGLNSSLQVMFILYDDISGTGHQMREISSNSVPLNQWFHLTATYGADSDFPNSDATPLSSLNTDIKIYLNGAQMPSSNSGSNKEYEAMSARRDDFPSLTIGNMQNASLNRPFHGELADICIFNKELSSQEVLEVYNNNSVKNMEEFSDYNFIVGWWKMGDDQDSTAADGIIDYVGGHDGTIVSGTSIQPAVGLTSDDILFPSRYGWFTDLVGHEVTGRGKHFIADDKQIVNREFVYSAKHRPPEVINSEDLVEIRTQDDLTFTKDAQVVTHFFAAEKSMYQVISDDMINLFATIVEFNDLIGQPVNRYRLQYKALEKFRARYFEKVKNVPSLEKYIELYKWIDSSIGLMLQELIPVSSNFSADLRNMVESHVLERNKYWTKFPTMEMGGEPPLGIAKGINELTYNWKDGHAPHAPVLFPAVKFTGQDWVQIPDSDILSFTDNSGNPPAPGQDQPFSISLEFNTSSNGGFLAGKKTQNGNTNYALDFFANGPQASPTSYEFGVFLGEAGTDDNGFIFKTFQTPAAGFKNQWHKVVLTYDGSETANGISVYLDNTLLPAGGMNFGMDYDGMPNTAGVFYIGAAPFSAVPNQMIKNVVVHNKELTQQEVINGDESAAVAKWTFNGTLEDSIGSLDGTFSGPSVELVIPDREGFLWHDQRAQGTSELISTGDTDVDENREILRRVSTRTTEGRSQVVERNNVFVEEDKPILRESPVSEGVPGAVYSGQAYVTRALSKPYKLNLDIAPTIHGGANYSPTTKDPNAFVRAVTRIIPGTATTGIDVDLADNPTTYEQWKELYTVKRNITVTIADTEINFTENYDGDVFYPYYGEDFRDPSAFITGHHNDSYGDDAEIPLQGPFTETWVGGNQHRHIEPMSKNEKFAVFNQGSVFVPDDDSLSFTDGQGFSLSMWVSPSKLDTFPGDHSLSQYKTLIHKNLEYSVFAWEGVLMVRLRDENSNTMMITYNALDVVINKWSHIAISYDGGLVQESVSVYVNGDEVFPIPGQPVTQLSGTLNNSGSEFAIGHPLNPIPSRRYEGNIRDVILIDGSVNQGEVNELYNNQPSEHSRFSDFIGWWELKENAESSVNSPTMDGTATNVNFVTTRPELYLEDTDGILKHPHEINPYLAAARYTRDEVAKRPINIRNIKTGESRLLGNYARDYEIVQTSSRTKNNGWFVDSGSQITSPLEIPFIVEDEQNPNIDFLGRRKRTTNFELPDRGRKEHVIAERFSAPGESLTLSRGYLDKIAEEFSVYNSMNFRNLDVRQPHHRSLYTHSGKYEGSQGYEDTQNGIPSIHKINRNTNHTPVGTAYDNAYISHQIPRSDYQYNIEMLKPNYYVANFDQGRIVVPDNSDLSFTNGTDDFSFAISLWVNIESWDAFGSARLFGKDASNNREYHALVLETGQVRFNIYDNDTAPFSFNTLTGQVSLKQWYHIVFNYNSFSSRMLIYINGQEVANIEEHGQYDHMDDGTSNFVIGCLTESSSLNYTGLMRDLVIFSAGSPNTGAILGANDVTELYNDNIQYHPRSDKLVAWWKLDKDAKSSINSPALNGTATNVEFIQDDKSGISFKKYLEEADIVKGENDYADYQGAGFRFIRNVENPQVINQRKNNIYSQLDRDVGDRTTSQYTEPAVVWNKPNTHFVLNETYDNYARTNQLSTEGLNLEELLTREVQIRRNSNPITYSYSNNLEMFSNIDLTRALDINKELRLQFSDALMKLFSKAELLFSRSIAREIIYPKHKNVGLTKSRNRSYFDSYKIFWKDKMLDRIKCSDTTKLGYELSSEQVALYGQSYSFDVMDNFFYKQSPVSGGALFVDTTSAINVDASSTAGLSFRSHSSSTDFSFVFSLWVNPIIGDSQVLFSRGGYYFSELVDYFGQEYKLSLENDGSLKFVQREENNGNTFSTSPGVIDFEENRYHHIVIVYDASLNTANFAGDMSFYVDGTFVGNVGKQNNVNFDPATQFPFIIGNENTNFSNISIQLGTDGFKGNMRDLVVFNFFNSNSPAFGQPQVNELYEGKIADHSFASDIAAYWSLSDSAEESLGTTSFNGTPVNVLISERYKVIGDLTYMGEDRIKHMLVRNDVIPLTTSRNIPVHPLEEKCSSTTAATLYSAPYPSEKKTDGAPIPSPQLYHNPHNDDYKESQGWISKKIQSSKNTPAYNDYESFSEEIRLAAQEYGLVSEFRISEHMDKYILENGGDFKAKNYDFLTLDGANYHGNSQEYHSRTSKKVVEQSVSTFYSVKKESEEGKVESYPIIDFSGRAANFSQGTILVSDNDDLSFNDNAGNDYSFAISLWVNVSEYDLTSGGNFGRLFGKYNGTVTNNREYSAVVRQAGQIRFFVSDPGSGQDVFETLTSFDFFTDNWNHIVFSYDTSNSTMSFWVNGVLAGTDQESNPAYTSMDNTTEGFIIGGSSSGTDFRGKMRDFVVFNFKQNNVPALSESDVLELYNNNIESHSRFSDIVAWWKLKENANSTINPTAMNGTATNVTFVEDTSLPIALTNFIAPDEQNVLIKNNANGFLELNKIYNSEDSTFEMSKSQNTNFEIGQTITTNYNSDLPYQDGINALALFNLEQSDNDHLLIVVDNVIGEGTPTTSSTKMNISPKEYNDNPNDYGYPHPITISVWAKLDEDRNINEDYGIWCAGGFDSVSMNLYANKNLDVGWDTPVFDNVGLVFEVASGGTIEQEYVFFKKDGSRALLEEGAMNHIVFQLVPPNPSIAQDSLYKVNYLMKLWLNGEELFGVHSSVLTSFAYINSVYQHCYSPVPIGRVQRPVSNSWNTTEDYNIYTDDFRTLGPITGCEDLNGITNLEIFTIGNCNHLNSRPQSPAKFQGALDEFVAITGLLPSRAIKALYNEGKPVNINELFLNEQLVGNLLTESSSDTTGEDNTEFDFGYKYYGDFDAVANDTVPSEWSVNSSPTGPRVVEATDQSNKIFALQGSTITTSSIQDPPTDEINQNNWRYAELNEEFKGTVDIEFRVWAGTGASDLYGLATPEDGDPLILQCEFDGDGKWNTLKTFFHFSEGVALDRIHSATVENPLGRTVKFRFITATNSTADEWGFDNLAISRRNRINQRSYFTSSDADDFKDDYIEIPFIDFSEENYSVSNQLELPLRVPMWHRIGIPTYTVGKTYETWDEEFFNSYVHTDNISFIEKADRKHDELGVRTKERVKLKVNAIKKLLPYDGFYPQDRTVQLANLFVEKISPDIIHNEKIYKEQAVQAALQHFFAPGILYNSIKAGIACDWASYTNESGLEPSYFGQQIDVRKLDNKFTTKYLSDAQPFWFTQAVFFDERLTGEESTRFSSTPSEDKYNLVDSPDDLFFKNYQLDNFGLMNIDTELDNNLDPISYLFNTKQLMITKEPNKRLPFESLLDPISYLQDGADEEEYTPSGSSVSVIRKPNQHYLVNPSYYKDHVGMELDFVSESATDTGNYNKHSFPFFELKKTQQSSADFRYQMAMNNFLSETVKFFIKEEKLSSFASRPENQFKVMSPGTTYYMDVSLSKTDGFNPVHSPRTLGGRYFGPPALYVYPRSGFDEQGNQLQGPGDSNVFPKIFTKDEYAIKDPAYAMYTPPYFYGESVARISFTPTDGERVYTLEEIFSKAKSSTQSLNKEIDDLFYNTAIEVTKGDSLLGGTQESFDGFYDKTPAYKSRMPLSSSIELFGKTSLMRQQYDPLGNPSSVDSANGTELDTWVIYSKFECPLFDFSDESMKKSDLNAIGISSSTSETEKYETIKYDASHMNPDISPDFNEDPLTGAGIWSAYGNQEDGRGVSISIRESFPKNRDPSIGSLIDICGFAPQSKQIGRVADSKEISEAVVMIPFLDEPLYKNIRTVGVGRSRQRRIYDTIQVDDRHFIKIDPDTYNEQKAKLDRGEPVAASVTSSGTEELFSTSITDMISGMRKYNIPPLYDFETYNEAPFAMYFFEFNHTLDREDLSNIWQGVQPKIAKEAILDSVEISHKIGPQEIFGNLQEIPKGIRWMVFKVKKKAEKNYYKLTEDSRDDSRFKFDFDVGVKEPEYGYNYPYDYFTMLELIQVEVDSEKEIDPLEQYEKATEED